MTERETGIVVALTLPHGALLDKVVLLQMAKEAGLYETIKDFINKVPAVIDSNMEDYQQLYFCDPDKNVFCSKTSCYREGGECMYTTRKECSILA